MSTATKNAAKHLKDADKAKEEAAKRVEAEQKIDAEFREAVAKATEKRDKALAKLSPGSNIAETAWNETKAEEDPLYKDSTADHRRKLDTVVEAVKTTGNADVVGLEDFEARVIELLAEAGTPAGTVAPFVASTAPPPPAPAQIAASDKKATAKAADKSKAHK